MKLRLDAIIYALTFVRLGQELGTGGRLAVKLTATPASLLTKDGFMAGYS